MKKFSTVVLLGLIAIVGVFTLDVYLPSIPDMANALHVSIQEIALTFTLFSIVFSVSQLAHGVLSDYIGRKPVLLGGLALAGFATLLCITAKSYDMLLFARILQAIGISVFVVVNAIIRDLLTGVDAIKMRAYVVTMSGISISVAPVIGGLLQHRLHWQGGFIASLTLIVLAFFYAFLFFKESNHNKTISPFSMSTFCRSYGTLFSDWRYMSFILQASLAYTVHFTFIIVSASIFMTHQGYTPIIFGYLMFLYGGMCFLSGRLTGFLSKKIDISHLILAGSICIGIGGVVMLVSSTILRLSTWYVLLPMMLMTLGITMIRASAATGALAPIPQNAGQGAAGLNLVQFMLSALVATRISATGDHLVTNLGMLAIACAVVIAGLMYMQSKRYLSRYFAKRTITLSTVEENKI